MKTTGPFRRLTRRFATVMALVAFCLSLSVGVGTIATAQSNQKAEIALSLATFLRSARAVVSNHQGLINDHTQGPKGFTGAYVLEEAKLNYEIATGANPDNIDPASLHGQLLKAEMEAVAEVVDAAQDRINRFGVGFKGFLPDKFARQVAERFSEKKGGIAEIKLTAPRKYVRNRDNLPDKWENSAIEENFKTADYPKDRPVHGPALKNGRPAFRLILPEYYVESCLACHGGPAGKRDITGGKKEGGTLGQLGGAISVVIYEG